MLGPQGDIDLPIWAMPGLMNNHGNYIASLANVCRWLGQQPRGWAWRSIRAWRPPTWCSARTAR